MQYGLTIREFTKIRPLLDKCLPDPMLYTVIEGNQPGRVFVDDREEPGCAYIWPRTEYSYIVGGSSSLDFYQSIHDLIEMEILPVMERNGMGFISIIPFTEAHREIFLELFNDRHPLSLGVNTFSFDEERFQNSHLTDYSLQDSFTLGMVDRGVLDLPVNEHIKEDIRYCWGSIGRFLELGMGTCILEGGKVASCCYALAYGAGSYHVNIWTAREYRRRGFAKIVCAAFIDRCLTEGKALYWLCDRDNLASRCLAESLGYEYQGDLYPVDVPCNPFEFYLGLGEHFLYTLQCYDQASQLYETAFTLGDADKDAFYRAAIALARAGYREKALVRLEEAIKKGWDDVESLLAEDGLMSLRDDPRFGSLLESFSIPE